VTRRQVIDLGTPEQLEQLAGVKFSEYDLADLAEAATTIFAFYHPEYALPPPPWMLEDANLPRRAATSEKDFRRGVVGFVAAAWHEAKWYEQNDGSQAGPYYWQGGESKREGHRGSFWDLRPGDSDDPELPSTGHTGPLARLLQHLFRAASGKELTAATLHHDLTFLRKGKERSRGKSKQSRQGTRCMKTAFAAVVLALATAPRAEASACYGIRDYDKRLACLADERRSPEGCTSIRNADARALCRQRAGESDPRRPRRWRRTLT
jgi:hypothetical protein